MEMAGRLVIVGTELPGAPEGAIEEACRWAKLWGSELLVVHVLDESRDVRDLRLGDAATRGLPETPHSVSAALAETAERVHRNWGIAVSTAVASGAPSVELSRMAEERGAGLIVVGAKGRSAFSRIVLGSVTERVVTIAGCPVLVVRSSPEGPILACTDFSDDSLPAARAATAVASGTGAPLIFMHCLEEPPTALRSAAYTLLSEVKPEVVLSRADAERFLGDAALALAPRAERIVTEGDPARAIARLAEERACSLVVVGARGRTGVARVVLGSVAQEVVRLATCSVLVVRLVSTE